MSSHINFPRFVPLSITSANNVFYYDSEAPLDSIYEAVEFRLVISHNLLSAAHKVNNAPDLLIAAIIASSVFIDEAHILLQELTPIALQLRKEKEDNSA